MEISENRIYLFKFQTDAGEVSFPVRADSREDAGQRIQNMFERMQIELSIEFPKVVPSTISRNEASSSSVIPPEVLELRIDTLLGDMGAGTLQDKAKADTIKLWTDHEYTPANYVKIIDELLLIKSGKKEIPSKVKKEKS